MPIGTPLSSKGGEIAAQAGMPDQENRTDKVSACVGGTVTASAPIGTNANGKARIAAAILRVEAEWQSRPERSPEAFRDAIPDFASLLREPVLPPLGSNNICGVSPPPSHLIPKKFTK